MQRSTLHKLLLTRRLLELARENLSSESELALGIGVNLLQDAVESFLLAVCDHLNAKVTTKTSFEQYLDLINVKICPKELPFRPRLLALNKLRVNSKHYGLAPAKSEVSGLIVTVREFFDEVTENVLGTSFATISLINLLRDGEAKDLLSLAEAAFSSQNFEEVLVCCRKAIYVRMESRYDIAPFGSGQERTGNALLLLANRSPYYARNKKYIDENVKDPTDFVVLDHNDIEMELMKSGIDSVSFWNIWRLTPEVWRQGYQGEWVVKREFRKFDEEGLQERAEYVLDATISLFVSADQRIAEARTPEYRNFYVKLKEQAVPIYEKADTSSKVVARTPDGTTQLYVDFLVKGLSGEGMFWHVSHHADGLSLRGYLHEDAIES